MMQGGTPREEAPRMSIDDVVICPALPEALTSYMTREKVDTAHLEADGEGAWGGILGGVRWWLVSRASWDAEDTRRYDRWLGARAEHVIHVAGSATRQGWNEAPRLARRIAHETDGVFVSLDEARVLYSPRSARRKKEEKDATKRTVDDALAHAARGDTAVLDALVAATLQLKAKKKAARDATAILAGVSSALGKLLDAPRDDRTAMAALADAGARARARLAGLTEAEDPETATPGLDPSLLEDRLVKRLADAHARLGPAASQAVAAIAEARARELTKSEGARWAAAHAPSTVDAADWVRRALAGELHACGVVYGWRSVGFGRWMLKQHPSLAALPGFAEGWFP
jgi:hypothetical protein